MKLGALLAMAVSLVSLNAFAAGDDYSKFLTAMEGSWEGNGSAYNRQTGQSTSFNFQMYDARQGEGVWVARTAKSASMGGQVRDSITFHLSGQILGISHETVFGMASVRFSTERSIEYVVMSSQGGSFLDYIYRWNVEGDGLSGSLVVERNGFRIYEESFSARKQDLLN